MNKNLQITFKKKDKRFVKRNVDVILNETI